MIIAIASGNDGTGETTLVASFVAIADNTVIAGWARTRPSFAAVRGDIKNLRVRKLQSWKKQAV